MMSELKVLQRLKADSPILVTPLGIATEYTAEGARLRNCQPSNINCHIDFTHCPDIAQTLAVTYCILGIPFTFEGIHSLRIKETDRVAALIAELRKLGYVLHAEGSTRLTWDGKRTNPIACPTISTYEDHRMAMGFSLIGLRADGIVINNPGCCRKTFENYFECLEKCIGQICK